MKKSDICEIAIKLLGIYLFITSAELISNILSAVTIYFQADKNPDLFGDFDRTPFVLLSIIHFALTILFAALLTFKTKAIVSLVFKTEDASETLVFTANRKVIYEIALVTTGLVTIVWALPDFIVQLKTYLQLKDTMPDHTNKFDFIFQSGIKIVIGLVAVVYANVIAKLFVSNNKNAISNNQ
ncbi:MAG: hypothetical protein ACK5Z2_20250 [Bacteroidota bacterium]|jgi:hypothetical protein